LSATLATGIAHIVYAQPVILNGSYIYGTRSTGRLTVGRDFRFRSSDIADHKFYEGL